MKIERTIDGKQQYVYYDGRLNELLEGFKNAVLNHKTTAVFLFDGRSGMGKTTLMNQVAIHLDPTYNLDKIFYKPKAFLDALSVAKKGDFIAFDEAMLFSNRSAMSQINKMIIQAMSMIRSKQIFIGFAVNSIFDLDKNLVLHRADALFHLYGQSLTDRGRFCAFFQGKDGYNRLKQLYLYGKKLYSYGKPQSNFVGRFTKEFVVDEKEYERRKQEGVNSFLRGTDKAMRVRNETVLKLRQKGMKVTEIAELVSLTGAQVYNILVEMGYGEEKGSNSSL